MPRRPDPPGTDGVLVMAKPVGPTSHDVVALARRLSGVRRIGHGGTLDPFASGVLPLFLGFATRLVEFHLGDEKAYRATVCFGASSTTDDLDGELQPFDVPSGGPASVGRQAVEATLARFLGPQDQRPPAYSAIQVGGRRAYDLARAGTPPDLALRRIEIRGLELVEWDDRDPERPIAIVDVTCSAGTYVRALARDLGATVGSAAYLGGLVRTRSGPFRLDDALTLDDLRAAAARSEGVASLLRPADAGLDAIPLIRLDPDEVEDARKGRFVRPAHGLGDAPEGSVVRLAGPDGRLAGIGRRTGHRILPDKMSAGAP